MAYEEVKQRIDTLKEKIETHGKLTDEQKKKINYKFRLEWNYNSNSMEGNTLTVAETRSVMIGNLDVHQKPIKDVIEMQGHDQVISEILNIGKGDSRLSEKRIQEIHKAIIHESEEIKKEQIGKWKTANNEIINYKGEKYTFVDYSEVKEKMHDLLNRTNTDIDAVCGHKKNAPHPIDIALNFHLEFLNIHPFHDGNGRTARILTNLILISFGYTPFWITKSERTIYYNYIADIQGYGGAPTLLNKYIANLILRSEQLVIDVIEGKDIEEDDDLDKEIAVWKKKLINKANLVPYSDLLISDLYTNSFRPLFLSYLERMSQFDDLFVKKDLINHIEAKISEYKKTQNIEFFDAFFEKLNNELKQEFEIEPYDKVGKVIYLFLELDYSGFKNDGINTFSQSSKLCIYFEEYKFHITLNSQYPNPENIILTKLYSETLTRSDVKTVVSLIVKRFFNNIQSSIKG